MNFTKKIIVTGLFIWISSLILNSTFIKCYAGSNETSTDMYIILEGGEFGYINKNGKVIIPPQFEDVSSSIPPPIPQWRSQWVFSMGIEPVKKNGKWGYIDKSGKWVILPQFERAEPFTEGLARVELNRKVGYINRNGKFVIQPQQFDWAYHFSEGLVVVVVDGKDGKKGKVGVIDKEGDWVIETTKFWPSYFVDGLAEALNYDRKYGFIDKKGKWVIEPKFSFLGSFSEGLAEAQLKNKGKVGYIDKKGNWIIKPNFKFSKHGFFSEGLAYVADDSGQFGYIDKKGKWVIKPQFSRASDFSEGLASVKSNSHYGYINQKGEWEIKPQFDSAAPFINGLAIVRYYGKFTYIDREGEIVWQEHK